jgi:hypothetical protein
MEISAFCFFPALTNLSCFINQQSFILGNIFMLCILFFGSGIGINGVGLQNYFEIGNNRFGMNQIWIKMAVLVIFYPLNIFISILWHLSWSPFFMIWLWLLLQLSLFNLHTILLIVKNHIKFI